jgi:mRNA interferase RelE/StbE
VTYTVIWDPPTITAASRYLADDPVGLTRLMDTVELLADDPRPPGSFPYGSEDLRRVRAGRYRVLIEIDPQARTVTVIHLGRT